MSDREKERINGLMRRIPSVDLVLNEPSLQTLIAENGKEKMTDLVRETLQEMRKKILDGQIQQEEQLSLEEIGKILVEKIRQSSLKKLQKTINATGVVIHTNLGRAPLSEKIVSESLNTIQNYSNLEYDLESGQRGSRHHYLKELIVRLTKAEDALVVNNNAAAVLLILSTFAQGKEVIVSRGELVEIGGSFRIPSVMTQGGAKLVEVGTTNKTHEQDYEDAINENTALLMKVHTSNYHVVGFTKSVGLEELKNIGIRHNIPVVEDLGSGVLVDLRKYGLSYEPTVQDSICKGIDIVSFSGDKLLGGPQAGIIIGKKKYIEQMKKNQLLRALRVDKVIISLLYNTFKAYFDEEMMKQNIPVIRMLSLKSDLLKERAEALKNRLILDREDVEIRVEPCSSQVGGGSLPMELIDSYALSIRINNGSVNELEKKLRLSEDHIIARIQEDALIMDMRTLFESEIEIVANRLNAIWREQK